MTWVWDHIDELLATSWEHLGLALVPVLVGLLISIPLGWVAHRYRTARAILVPASSLLYTIPSLALFVLMPLVLGTRILDPINVVVTLTIYTVALLVRSVADALAAVPTMVVASATAMGYRPRQRFLTVELPLSVPVLVAGLRVATVANISLVSVGALIGVGGLGELFTDGYQRNFPTEIVTGVLLTVALALVCDALLLAAGRLTTPWERAGNTGGRAR
jgi:osmoprotectant transport system permease protein